MRYLDKVAFLWLNLDTTWFVFKEVYHETHSGVWDCGGCLCRNLPVPAASSFGVAVVSWCRHLLSGSFVSNDDSAVFACFILAYVCETARKILYHDLGGGGHGDDNDICHKLAWNEDRGGCIMERMPHHAFARSCLHVKEKKEENWRLRRVGELDSGGPLAFFIPPHSAYQSTTVLFGFRRRWFLPRLCQFF